MSKIKNIFDAWTKELPVNEEWYKKRLETCRACDHNSANSDKEPENLGQELLQSLWRIAKKDFCTLCGCPLAQKTSVPAEVCALAERGGVPKWGARVVANKGEKIARLYEVDGYKYSLNTRADGIIELWLGETNANMIEFEFDVEHEKELTFMSVVPTCSCTVPTPTPISENKNRVKVKLSTTTFAQGHLTSRTIKFKYVDSQNREKLIQVQCKIRRV